jgi:glucose-6-phosphate 1-dehydrogenase
LIRTLLLLGATGDLAKRFLLPALGVLVDRGLLAEGFRIVGAARGELDDEGVRALAGDDIPTQMLTYRAVDLAEPSSLTAALDGTTEPAAVYLALPPAVFATTIESLAELGLPSGSRVVVEKPFGDELESARKLNTLLAQTGIDAYRVDHVLGMETVQNLIAMRRGNPVLERVWNGASVERVEILWEETLALEGRAGYYDSAGAVKDVLQNHMLQLLTLVAMKPPADDGNLNEPKLSVLNAVRVAPGSRRARYTAGTLADGREVGPYVDEDGVDPGRCTETFAEVPLELDDPLWEGTRFVLRAGKALASRRKLAVLRFRGGGELEVGIDGPKDIVVRLAGAASERLELCAPAPGSGLPPYAHVLLDVLGGTSTLAVGGDEAEQAWRIVAPILATWEAGDVPLEEYPAGSSGPPSWRETSAGPLPRSAHEHPVDQPEQDGDREECKED